MVKRLSAVDQNSRPLTNVPTPSAGTDAANKQYVIDQIAAIPGGSGDVVGPSGATANSVAIFNGTTGKIIKEGLGMSISLGEVYADSSFNAPFMNTTAVTTNTVDEYDSDAGVTVDGVLLKDGGVTTAGGTGAVQAGTVLSNDGLLTVGSGSNYIEVFGSLGVLVTGTLKIGGVVVPTISSTSTFTNKTLTLPTISSSSANPGQTDAAGVMRYNGGFLYYGNGSAELQLATTSSTQTLTGKTLTSPVISSISNTGTLTLPTSTDTLVGRATTDTLTNKRITPRIGTVASSATPTINTDNVDQFNITALAAAITSMTTNLSGTPTDGQKLMIRIKDNGTARAITWGASFVSSGVATLLATTVISKTHMVGFIYDAAAAKWVCVAVDATGY